MKKFDKIHNPQTVIVLYSPELKAPSKPSRCFFLHFFSTYREGNINVKIPKFSETGPLVSNLSMIFER